MTSNQRPGVYSQYDVSSFYTTAATQRYAGVAARAQGGEGGELYSFASYADACAVFGPDREGSHMRGCLKILFECGVSRVYAAAVEEGDYSSALKLLEEADNLGALVCDAREAESLEALAQSVQNSSAALRERVAFCGLEDPEEAISRAKALNCERVVLCCPVTAPRELEDKAAVYTAAALAGTVLAAGDPAANFSGMNLRCVSGPGRLPEARVQALLAAGVTVVEQVGESVQIVRALTTRTETGGVEDRTMTGLNTILIIDDVMTTIRSALELRLGRGRITTRSYGSVVSQVTVELAAKQDSGVIESFAQPKVYAHESDPAICVVELSFQVAHVVNQIHVVAHIQV